MEERHDIYFTNAKSKVSTRDATNIVALLPDFTDNGVPSLIWLLVISDDSEPLHFDGKHLQIQRFIFC